MVDEIYQKCAQCRRRASHTRRCTWGSLEYLLFVEHFGKKELRVTMKNQISVITFSNYIGVSTVSQDVHDCEGSIVSILLSENIISPYRVIGDDRKQAKMVKHYLFSHPIDWRI